MYVVLYILYQFVTICAYTDRQKHFICKKYTKLSNILDSRASIKETFSIFQHVRMESESPFGEFVDSVSGNIIGQEDTEAQLDVGECELPLIDLSHLNLGNPENEECKRKICEASAEWGFFQIVNHGVCQEIFSRIHWEQVELFRQPLQEKTNEKLLNLSSGCYQWERQTAATWKQFGWSEAFHIPVTTVSQLNELEDLRYICLRKYILA